MIVSQIFLVDKQILFSPSSSAGHESVPENLPTSLVKQSCLCLWKMLGHNLSCGYLVKREWWHTDYAFGKMSGLRTPRVVWHSSEGGRLLEQTPSWDLVGKLDWGFFCPCPLFIPDPVFTVPLKKTDFKKFQFWLVFCLGYF